MNMKLFIEKIPDLEALYEKQLRLLLSAEETSAIKLAFFMDSATDRELHHALEEHRQETAEHGVRLREILAGTEGGVEAQKFKAIYALFDEAEDLLQDVTHDEVRDALLISAAQRIEHYEIAAYGALRQYAHLLGREGDARILDRTFDEEKHTDLWITNLSERINPTACKAA
jgi:ferritin-like metal-binding protein YciE